MMEYSLAIGSGFVALIVWAIRLEGKIIYTEKNVEKLFHLEEKISDIRESLARIEGQLGIGSKLS